jgi:hypothetical protein
MGDEYRVTYYNGGFMPIRISFDTLPEALKEWDSINRDPNKSASCIERITVIKTNI